MSGSDKVPHPVYRDRWADGTQRPGFPGPALKHGVHSYESRGAGALPTDLRLSVDDFRAHVISDRGGAENLTAIEGGYIRRIAELETVVRLLASDLARRGIFTPRGRVRGTFSRWLEALDRWDRFAQRIGHERRAMPVPSLSEYLARRGNEVGKPDTRAIHTPGAPSSIEPVDDGHQRDEQDNEHEAAEKAPRSAGE